MTSSNLILYIFNIHINLHTIHNVLQNKPNNFHIFLHIKIHIIPKITQNSIHHHQHSLIIHVHLNKYIKKPIDKNTNSKICFDTKQNKHRITKPLIKSFHKQNNSIHYIIITNPNNVYIHKTQHIINLTITIINHNQKFNNNVLQHNQQFHVLNKKKQWIQYNNQIPHMNNRNNNPI